MKVKAVRVGELEIGDKVHWAGLFRFLDAVRESADQLYVVLTFHVLPPLVLDQDDIVLIIDE